MSTPITALARRPSVLSAAKGWTFCSARRPLGAYGRYVVLGIGTWRRRVRLGACFFVQWRLAPAVMERGLVGAIRALPVVPACRLHILRDIGRVAKRCRVRRGLDGGRRPARRGGPPCLQTRCACRMPLLKSAAVGQARNHAAERRPPLGGVELAPRLAAVCIRSVNASLRGWFIDFSQAAERPPSTLRLDAKCCGRCRLLRWPRRSRCRGTPG